MLIGKFENELGEKLHWQCLVYYDGAFENAQGHRFDRSQSEVCGYAMDMARPRIIHWQQT